MIKKLKPTLQLIKLSEAAKILGVSTSSIRHKKAGTKDLTLYKRPDSNLLFVDRREAENLAKNFVEAK